MMSLPPHPHQACLPSLPRMPQSTSSLCGQNPLKVPLLCGFKRLTAMPLITSLQDGEEDDHDWDVIYKAPCGQSLRNLDDVMCFLSVTDSYDVLQVRLGRRVNRFSAFSAVLSLHTSEL